MTVTLEDIKNGRCQLRNGKVYEYIGISGGSGLPVGNYYDETLGNQWIVISHKHNGLWQWWAGEYSNFDLVLKPEFRQPEPDTDGWIESNGQAPDYKDRIDIKRKDGTVSTKAHYAFNWHLFCGVYNPITHWRPHKEAKPSPKLKGEMRVYGWIDAISGCFYHTQVLNKNDALINRPVASSATLVSWTVTVEDEEDAE